MQAPDATRQESETENLYHQFPQFAQDEVSTLSPVPFDSETRNDEVAVDVPLPEETAEMSGENGQGWIIEEAFFNWHLQRNVSS